MTSEQTDNESRQPLWYLRHEGETKGPFPSGAVRRFVVLGRLQLDDQVSQDGEQWQPVSEVPEVVPPEVRSALAEGRLEELLPQQMREDERRGLERRTPESDAVYKERRKGERRQKEAQVAQRLRKAKAELVALRQHRRLPTTAIGVAGALVVLAVGYGLIVGAPNPIPDPDCSAPAAPGVNWRNCRIDSLRVESANLEGANLTNSQLREAALSAAHLVGADMSYADLAAADLSYGQLSGAMLKGATLRGADLSYADLTGADLSFADLTGANLGGVKLDQARLEHAIWSNGQTCLAGSVGNCRVPK